MSVLGQSFLFVSGRTSCSESTTLEGMALDLCAASTPVPDLGVLSTDMFSVYVTTRSLTLLKGQGHPVWVLLTHMRGIPAVNSSITTSRTRQMTHDVFVLRDCQFLSEISQKLLMTLQETPSSPKGNLDVLVLPNWYI